MTFKIKMAEPAADRLLITIIGPQNAGKTTSALRLATGITQQTGGKILVIDTERKRALRYAKNFKFNHLELDAPYSPDRYDEAIQYAEKNGYGQGDVIVIDSMSHEHDGPGGVLELHESYLDKKAGDDYGKRDRLNMLAWNNAKKGRKRLIHFTLAQARPHVILCFRAKEKPVMVKNEKTNKTEVVNHGLEPIGGQEYFFEMQIAFVLPESSGGHPDWKAESSRINEYGEGGPLKTLLYSAPQITEDMGRRLAEIEQAEISGSKKDKEPVDPNDPRTIATKIGLMIHNATDSNVLSMGWQEYAEEGDLEKIKSASTVAYDNLVSRYNNKMSDLSELK